MGRRFSRGRLSGSCLISFGTLLGLDGVGTSLGRLVLCDSLAPGSELTSFAPTGAAGSSCCREGASLSLGGGGGGSGCPVSLAGRALLGDRLVFTVLRLLLNAELEAGFDALESPFSSSESTQSSTVAACGCLPAGFVSAMVRCSLNRAT